LPRHRVPHRRGHTRGYVRTTINIRMLRDIKWLRSLVYFIRPTSADEVWEVVFDVLFLCLRVYQQDTDSGSLPLPSGLQNRDILGNLWAFFTVLQSPAAFYRREMTDANRWTNPLNSGSDPADYRIRINPEMWIRIPDDFDWDNQSWRGKLHLAWRRSLLLHYIRYRIFHYIRYI